MAENILKLEQLTGILTSTDEVKGEATSSEDETDTPTGPTRTRSKLKPYQCQECKRRFDSEIGLNGHKRFHEKGIKLSRTCETCGKEYPSSASIRHHRARYRRKGIPCNITIKLSKMGHKCSECGKVFKYVSSLDDHLRTHTCVYLHSCGRCPLRFRTQSELNYHAYSHVKLGTTSTSNLAHLHGQELSLSPALIQENQASGSEKPFKCEHCQKQFAEQGNLEKHLHQHNLDPPKCNICNKCFLSERGLTEHMKEIHSDEKYKYHECHTCGKKFGLKLRFEQHVRQVHKEYTELKCKKCQLSFDNKFDFADHLRLHKQMIKRFNCEHCQCSFYVLSKLVAHMKTHVIQNNPLSGSLENNSEIRAVGS